MLTVNSEMMNLLPLHYKMCSIGDFNPTLYNNIDGYTTKCFYFYDQNSYWGAEVTTVYIFFMFIHFVQNKAKFYYNNTTTIILFF